MQTTPEGVRDLLRSMSIVLNVEWFIHRCATFDDLISHLEDDDGHSLVDGLRFFISIVVSDDLDNCQPSERSMLMIPNSMA